MRVRIIEKLSEVADGYVVVPGTSAKAFNMESQNWAIRNGDFDIDPTLSDLIISRKISDCAIRSFKTFGASKVWVHESEVTSYRDLILHEITEQDRWRGRAWVLDARKIKEHHGCRAGS